MEALYKIPESQIKIKDTFKEELCPTYERITDSSKNVTHSSDFNKKLPSVSISLNNGPDVSSQILIDNENGKLTSEFKQNIRKNGTQIKMKFKNDKKSSLTLEKTLPQNGNIFFEAKCDGLKVEMSRKTPFFTPTFEIRRNLARRNLDLVMVPKAVFFYNKFSLGTMAAFSAKSLNKTPSLVDFNGALSYNTKNMSFSLYTKKSFSKYTAKAFYRKSSDLAFGLHIDGNTKSFKEVIGKVGCEWKVNDKINMKARLNSCGCLSTVFSQKVSQGAKISVMSEFEVRRFMATPKLGVGVDFSTNYKSVVGSERL